MWTTSGMMPNPQCDEIRASLDPYLSGEADAAARSAIADHLSHCPACAAELAARESLRRRLKAAVDGQSVPSGLRARVVQRLEDRQRRSWSWPVWTVAGAVAASLVAGALFLSRPLPLPAIADRAGQQTYIQKVSATLNGVLRVGLGDHIHCSIFRRYPVNPPTPAEMSNDLGPSYQGLLSIVTAAAPAGYRVIMAHECGFAGRRFIHLTLEKDGELASLVIARKQPGESLAALSVAGSAPGVAVYQSSTDRYQVAAFDAGGYLAYVISQMRPAGNLQFAETLAPQVRELLLRVPA